MKDSGDAGDTGRRSPNYAVWLMVGIPLTAVVVGISMAVVSFRTFDGVVVDDYYKQGKEINRTLARDNYARDMGIRANLSWEEGVMTVAIQTDKPVELPPELVLQILHPTRAGLDTQVALFADQPDKSIFRGDISALPEGSRIYQLETDQWRLNQRANTDAAAQPLWSLQLHAGA